MERGRFLGRLVILCTLLAATLLIGPGIALSTPIDLGYNYATDYQGDIYGNWYTQYKFAFTGEPFSETLGDSWDSTNPAIAFCIDKTLGTEGPYTVDTLSGYLGNDAPFTVPDYDTDKLALAAKYADYFFTHGGNQSAYQVAIWMELGVKGYIDNALGNEAQNIRDMGIWDDSDSLTNALVVAYSEGGQNYLRRSAAPVPEPGTIVLMGLGLVGLGTVGRKKFKK